MKYRTHIRSKPRPRPVHRATEAGPACRTRAHFVEMSSYADRVTCERCRAAMALAEEIPEPALRMFACNVCDGAEPRERGGDCPWCGEGVMQEVNDDG